MAKSDILVYIEGSYALTPGDKCYVQKRDTWFKHSIFLNGLSYDRACAFNHRSTRNKEIEQACYPVTLVHSGQYCA